MKAHFKQLDRLLRGEATTSQALQFGSVMISLNKILLISILLAAFSGLCVGTYALVNGHDAIVQRMIATVLKIPTLFFLTLLITFPSLYAFNAIIGSRIEIVSLLRLLVGTIGVMVTVLASFGPIVAFFSVSATSYPFILLLNVLVFAIAGLLGFRFLHRTLERFSYVSVQENETSGSNAQHSVEIENIERMLQPNPSTPGPLDRTSDKPTHPKVQIIFRIWILVFGLVGAQMSWVLRPIIGNPDAPNGAFKWFGTRESSFFEAVGEALIRMLLG